MNVVLISTYELGRQPFGLASPAAWLSNIGAEVTCMDLSVQRVNEDALAAADFIAFYVPMHTATRLAVPIVKQAKRLNATAHLCFYGLYAPLNEAYLRSLGAQTILGGEFEEGLVQAVKVLIDKENKKSISLPPAEIKLESSISLARQNFVTPDRSVLPGLEKYAFLTNSYAERKLVGYTEASRGCKHLCRHCPVVPVYGGKFRVVQKNVVLDDIRQQVSAGAKHITFGDPDFFNGPGHAVPIVEALHDEFPWLTYDVTIKVQHLLKHRQFLSTLKETGCEFVTCAVESVDDSTLEKYEKHHTKADFIEAVGLFREIGLTMNPTFVTFSPWVTLEGYIDLLLVLLELELVDHVTPIQYAIRLLLPAGSRLLELDEVSNLVGPFDQEKLCYPWEHPDPKVDALHNDVMEIVKCGQAEGVNRRTIFNRVWRKAHEAAEMVLTSEISTAYTNVSEPIPFLSEAWYC